MSEKNNYPSILNLTLPDAEKTIKLPAETFTDVRLDALLPEDAIEIMRVPCGADDIEARREIIRALDSADFRDEFRRLEKSLADVKHSSEFLATARSDNERYVYFATYADASASFMHTASELHYPCKLTARMAEYFKRITAGERFAELRKKLAASRSALAVMAKFRVRVNENSSTINEENDPLYGSRSYFEAVAESMEQLGFDTGIISSRPPVKLSVGFTDGLARMFSAEFAALLSLYIDFRGLLDDSILFYRREIGFYLAVHELHDRVRSAGIPTIYPEISAKPCMTGADFYDISLLAREVGGSEIVPNDIDLAGADAFCFLVGANGGGKTTYIRTVGIALLLFLSGSPIPARSATIYPFRRVYSHFPADERFEDTGRLLDEVKRMQPVLDNAGADTLVLLNETYSGTDERRANELTRETTEKLRAAGTFGVYVTHFHDVADMGVTMLSAVIDPNDSNRRLYKIVKKTSEKSSYAADILKKYRLDRAGLSQRSASARTAAAEKGDDK